MGAVAGFLLVAITVLGIAIAVLAYCKKNATPTKDPVYDYIDTKNPLYDYIDTDDEQMQPVRHSLEIFTNTAYGTTTYRGATSIEAGEAIASSLFQAL